MPLGYTIYLSTQKTRVIGLGLGANARQQVAAGFSNYTTVFHDTEFWDSVVRALLYGCILIPVMLGLAITFALILDAQRVKFQRLGRMAIFLPYAVPTLIGSMIWGMMYLPAFSPINCRRCTRSSASRASTSSASASCSCPWRTSRSGAAPAST